MASSIEEVAVRRRKKTGAGCWPGWILGVLSSVNRPESLSEQCGPEGFILTDSVGRLRNVPWRRNSSSSLLRFGCS
jgi:hypothetical protein